MATITSRGITWNTTAANKTVTATPAVGDLIVVVCANSGRTSAQPPTVTDNNSSGTYTRSSVSATKNTSADSMWFFVRDTFILAASSTIFTMTQTSDTGGGLAVFSISGMSRVGLQAIRQEAKQDNQASGTPAVTFNTIPLSNSPLIGAVITTTNGTANSSPPTGFSEAHDLGYTTPAMGIEVTYSPINGITDNPITWGAAAPSAFGSMMVEFNANPESLSTQRELYQQILAH